MKNFISINAKHYKKNEIKRIINHNVRLEEPTYILETQKGIVGILDHIFLNELKFRKEQQLKDLREVCEDKNDNVKTKKMKL